ncbi:MAG: bifunctional 5,10-methylenetetrahydrofolate dehydrogenase/5,10-methenyltetrahydrofolate cyclohydrolase [bacterium]|nr:bifunctional 5,10-methylenetetrahydrofolate dehydrogenase/5,10-methenyltetrahydrofolate cyclohydrolase [bacterium]
MAIVLDGEKLSKKIRDDLKKKIGDLGRTLHLAIVRVGDDPATNVFIKMKERVGKEMGVEVTTHAFEKIERTALQEVVLGLSADDAVDGILIQLPLVGIDNEQEILDLVSADKDVDVLGVQAIGRLRHYKEFLYPPVVGSIMALFEAYHIQYRNAFVVLFGGGRLVGSALNTWFKRRDQRVGHAIITEHTTDPEKIIALGDIIIAGVPGEKNAEVITGDMIKDGAVVIDAGYFKLGERRVGNVHFESVSKKASHITPVPGGIGPLTVVWVYKNLYFLASRRIKNA